LPMFSVRHRANNESRVASSDKQMDDDRTRTPEFWSSYLIIFGLVCYLRRDCVDENYFRGQKMFKKKQHGLCPN
jgi:hypothetical protein